MEDSERLSITIDGMRRLFEEISLKVVDNEKGGGSGGWLLFKDAFGPWRSMFNF
jgi:hypothetical protein